MCKESLEVGSFFFLALPTVWESSQAKHYSCWEQTKIPSDLKQKPSNNPTSAKFSDCNQVRQSYRLLEEAAVVEVEETGRDRTTNALQGLVVSECPGGKRCPTFVTTE